MAYRNKTYVCFDGDKDMHYYRLMTAWHQNDNSPFSFYNAHDVNRAFDTSMELSIKRQLRERLMNTKIFVVLIGENTRYLYRFVKWEMEQAISLNLPIIGVNLNGKRHQDGERVPPTIRSHLAVYISFNVKIMQFALEHWPSAHAEYVRQGRTGPFYYEEHVYRQLGL